MINIANREERIKILRDKFEFTGPINFDENDQLILPRDLFCSKTITSFEGGPDIICGDLYCNDNKNITSLEHSPVQIGGSFICKNCNNLTSLEGAPKLIYGGFDCSDNNLISLKGSPIKIGYYFDCSKNNLTSLVGAPKIVGTHFSCHDNYLTSLDGIPKEIHGDFSISVFHNTPLLKILGVTGIIDFVFYKNRTNIVTWTSDRVTVLEELFKKFYGKGVKGQLQCGIEMMRLGYGSNAKL